MKNNSALSASKLLQEKDGADGARTRIIRTLCPNLRNESRETTAVNFSKLTTGLLKNKQRSVAMVCAKSQGSSLEEKKFFPSVVKEVFQMRTISQHGLREERQIDEQITLAKVAYCLRKYDETHDHTWYDKAVEISERDNGFWKEVQETVTDIEAFLMNREVKQ